MKWEGDRTGRRSIEIMGVGWNRRKKNNFLGVNLATVCGGIFLNLTLVNRWTVSIILFPLSLTFLLLVLLFFYFIICLACTFSYIAIFPISLNPQPKSHSYFHLRLFIFFQIFLTFYITFQSTDIFNVATTTTTTFSYSFPLSVFL
jgi:hypothetical protein